MRVEVTSIQSWEVEPWLLNAHYAGRVPSISFAFGLYVDGDLSGICTYGSPPAAAQREGVCGKEYIPHVIELNRLCLRTGARNAASVLVGRSLRLLGDKVVLSYADASIGHVGFVYQATNWLYCGLTEKRTDWAVEGLEGMHGQSIGDISKGQADRFGYMRRKYGDKFSLVDRPRKHRYVKFVGNRRFCRDARRCLRYEEQPYPKGDTVDTDQGGAVAVQQCLL